MNVSGGDSRIGLHDRSRLDVRRGLEHDDAERRRVLVQRAPGQEHDAAAGQLREVAEVRFHGRDLVRRRRREEAVARRMHAIEVLVHVLFPALSSSTRSTTIVHSVTRAASAPSAARVGKKQRPDDAECERNLDQYLVFAVLDRDPADVALVDEGLDCGDQLLATDRDLFCSCLSWHRLTPDALSGPPTDSSGERGASPGRRSRHAAVDG